MNKKILCLFLSMIIGVMAIMPSVSAESNDVVDSKDIENTLEFLQVIGMGTDYDTETTQFSDKITRAVFVDNVVKMLGEDATQYNAVYYHDVSRDYWAAGAIGYLTQRGILHGSGEDKFYPDGEITKNEAYKIIISVLNYGEIAEAEGGFPTGYIKLASKLDISDGVTGSEYVTIYDMLKLIENALCAEELEATVFSNSGIEYKTSEKTLLNRVFDFYEESGVVTACEEINATGEVLDDEDTAIIDDVKYKYELTNMLEYLGDEVDFIYHYDNKSDKKKIVKVWKRKGNNSLEIAVDGDASFDETNYTLSYMDSNGKSRRTNISKGVIVFFNGEFVGSNIDDYFNKNHYDLKLFKSNGSNGYDTALIWEYENYSVKSKEAYGQIIYNNIDNTKILNLEENNYDKIDIINAQNDKLTFEDIALGNILSVYKSESGKRIRVVVSNKQISGVVSSIGTQKNESDIEVDDTTYVCYNEALRNVKPGDNITAYFDVKDKIAYIDRQGSDFFLAYIIGAKESGGFHSVEVKMIKDNGEVVVLSCDDKIKIDGKTAKHEEIISELKEDGTTKQRLVCITVNADNIIKEIDTEYINPSYETEDESLTNYIELTRSCVFKKTNTIGKLGSRILLDKNTVVFSVPNGYTTNEDEFSIKNLSDFVVDQTYDVAAYKVYNKDVDYSDILIVKGKEWYDSKNSDVDILVESIGSAINSVGDSAEVLHGYSGKSYISLSTDGEYSLKSAGINPGDVLRVTKNKYGDIKNATIAYKYGGEDKPRDSSVGLGYRKLFGYAHKTVGSTLQMGFDNAEDFDEAFELSDVPVLVFNPDERQVIRVGSIDDLKTYDIYGAECSNIYVQAHTSLAKMVVVYAHD